MGANLDLFRFDDKILSDKVLNTKVLGTKVFDNDAEVLGLKEKEENIDYSQNIAGEIIINSVRVTGHDILRRQSAIKKSIPINEYNKLTIQEKLIIDLPIIMTKLGWLYSAYCQIHWLEGSGNDVEVPIEFVSSYPRVQKAYKNMRNNFAVMKYASIDEYNHLVGFSLDGSASYLMYDFDVPSIQEAYYKAVDYLKTISDFGEHTFGNFNFNEPPPKINFVRSYIIGSALGDLDDLGASFGRFSLRAYVKGLVQDQNLNDPDYRQFYFNISDVGFRYIDEFSFNGEQRLGFWKYDINNPALPKRFSSPDGWYGLSNKDYRTLNNRNLGLGKDFILKTEPRYLSSKSGLKVKSNIIFFFPK